MDPELHREGEHLVPPSLGRKSLPEIHRRLRTQTGSRNPTCRFVKRLMQSPIKLKLNKNNFFKHLTKKQFLSELLFVFEIQDNCDFVWCLC
jgi:hypothetical protein